MQGSVAKKPYNPIRGEAFHCSWRIPSQKAYPPSPEHPKTENGANGFTDDQCLLTYCAEQVSHHPPSKVLFILYIYIYIYIYMYTYTFLFFFHIENLPLHYGFSFALFRCY